MVKQILLTGATDGLGALAASMLAQLGHKLILLGRRKDALQEIADRLSQKTDVTTYCSDLAHLEAVAETADKIISSHQRIDVIINNAGVLKAENTKTIDGLELRFVVNMIAPYLLTKKLLPLVPSGGRIVNLSSAAQRPLEPMQISRFDVMTDMDAYAQSKLGITAWTRRLAQDHQDKVLVSVNPASLLGTKMVKQGFGIEGSDISVGADIICEAALSESFSAANGLYYDNDAKCFAPPHDGALDDDLALAYMREMDAIIARL